MYKYKTIRGLLKDKNRWTKGCSARDKYDVPTKAMGSKAVKFCLIGACHKVYGKKYFNETLHDLLRDALPNGIVNFNDDVATHEQVLELVTKLKI